jgi:hypothetical protein
MVDALLVDGILESQALAKMTVPLALAPLLWLLSCRAFSRSSFFPPFYVFLFLACDLLTWTVLQ